MKIVYPNLTGLGAHLGTAIYKKRIAVKNEICFLAPVSGVFAGKPSGHSEVVGPNWTMKGKSTGSAMPATLTEGR